MISSVISLKSETSSSARCCAIWSGGNNWLPDHLLNALARGGNGDATYYHALLMLAIYSIAVAIGTVALFRRRDA